MNDDGGDGQFRESDTSVEFVVDSDEPIDVTDVDFTIEDSDTGVRMPAGEGVTEFEYGGSWSYEITEDNLAPWLVLMFGKQFTDGQCSESDTPESGPDALSDEFASGFVNGFFLALTATISAYNSE